MLNNYNVKDLLQTAQNSHGAAVSDTVMLVHILYQHNPRLAGYAGTL